MNMLPTNPNPGDHRSEGNVDQIRDILFGGQMREYDHRFALLERQAAGDHERMRQEIEDRFRSLAEQSSAVIRQLGEQLEAERTARAAEAQSAQGLHAAVENLTRQLAEANERSEARLRELETQLREHAAQHQAAHETARQEREALATRLDEQLRQLTGVVAERDALSELFTEMAGRLRRPPQPPSA
jgi:DNA repair exonuclease SbcCD ATPase subunit